jgi:hypothetical protein
MRVANTTAAHVNGSSAHLAGAPLVDALLVGSHGAWHGLLALQAQTPVL